MSLKITLKPKEKMIVGNAVISNAGSSDCYIRVENNSTILREKNIMSEKDAKTPCQQLYFIIQLMYIDNENKGLHEKNYWKLSQDITQAAPSTQSIVYEINHHVSSADYYKALRSAQTLIEYETELFNNFIAGSTKNDDIKKPTAIKDSGEVI